MFLIADSWTLPWLLILLARMNRAWPMLLILAVLTLVKRSMSSMANLSGADLSGVCVPGLVSSWILYSGLALSGVISPHEVLAEPDSLALVA